MAILYEYYNTGADDVFGLDEDFLVAMTFTPQISHTLSYIRLLLYRYGEPGTILVAIMETSEGKPTEPLTSFKDFDGNELTEDESGEWKVINFENVLLSAGTKYAIIVCAPEAVSPVSELLWLVNWDEPTYPRGNALDSPDGGETWWEDEADCMFEEWGEPLTPPGGMTGLNPVMALLI